MYVKFYTTFSELGKKWPMVCNLENQLNLFYSQLLKNVYFLNDKVAKYEDLSCQILHLQLYILICEFCDQMLNKKFVVVRGIPMCSFSELTGESRKNLHLKSTQKMLQRAVSDYFTLSCTMMRISSYSAVWTYFGSVCEYIYMHKVLPSFLWKFGLLLKPNMT